MTRFIDRLKSPSRKKRRIVEKIKNNERTKSVPEEQNTHPGKKTLEKQREKIVQVFEDFAVTKNDEDNQSDENTTEQKESKKAQKSPEETSTPSAYREAINKQKNKASEIFRQQMDDEIAELGKKLAETKIRQKIKKKKKRQAG
jgi:hypothetical protein